MPSRAVTRPYLKGEPDFEIRSAVCGESTELSGLPVNQMFNGMALLITSDHASRDCRARSVS
jgi:hypothetical protein